MSIDLIKIIAINVDGVMTDGNVYVTENGSIFKNFNTKDIKAISRAFNDGYKIVFITDSTDRVIYAQFGKTYPIVSATKIKFIELDKFLLKNNLSWQNVAYIGSDESDYKILLHAGLFACPNDAISEILDNAVYPSPYKGGNGAVYDIIRYIYTLKKVEWIKKDK